MTAAFLAALVALGIWICLLLGRGNFWRAMIRDDQDEPAAEPDRWPGVVALVPARNEAEMVPRSIASLIAQDYAGPFSIILVDDNSSDGTEQAARETARRAGGVVTVLPGAALPPGWTGKLWALSQGIDRVERLAESPKYLLLTDADIVHVPNSLRSLVMRAEAEGLVLTSLMAQLRCESLAERALIPAFVFFFQMLYPFAWVNRRDCRTAAAAGGCMLVDYASLAATGGMLRSAMQSSMTVR